jgi:phytoene desaturase
MKNQTIIIGAGFSGLAAAASLAKKGRKVLVLEKNSTPGGRASQLISDGFTFDKGPSWYWLPDVFEDFFADFGKKPSDYYDLVRLDPSYKVYYGKDDHVNIPASLEGLYKVFEDIEPGSSKKLEQFLKDAEYKYNIGVKDLVKRPAKSFMEFAEWRVIKDVFRLDVFKSFHKYIHKNFKHHKLFPILQFPIIFLGATPKRTPALYNLMNYADMKLGTWYPMGGFYSVILGMEKLAKELGVEFIYNSPVEKIEVENKKVKAVHTADKTYHPEAVIASADYHHVEQHLIDKNSRNYEEKYWDSREMAPSSLLFYLGIDKKLNNLEHHNLFFDEDFDTHANELFEDPMWPSKPLLYTSVTSKTDPEVAPEGKENLVVLIPVAPGLKDTEQTREKYYTYIMDKLESLTGQSIRDHVIFKKSYAHNDFASEYNAFKGNAYGLGNTLMQTAFLKPKMHAKKIKNLVFAGQLTTPGPGVPPSIISGQVAAGEIEKILNN